MNEINVVINKLIINVKLKVLYRSALQSIGFDVTLPDDSSLSQKINEHSIAIADCRNKINQLITTLLLK